jgi:hypothetical protein
MTRRTLASDRRRRKMMTALWIFIVTIGVIVLIYREMTAVLYILATLGVTALLLVVAFSDLVHVGGSSDQSSSNDAR